MPSDGGFDPQVGEIRAVRSFRVGPGGLLFPLFSRRPWVDGTNDAVCNAARSVIDAREHVTPAPDCTCGFYAYADLASAAEYPHARNVLAVVTCWGRIIVGTKGLRAQHARIEAVWLSKLVPDDLAQLVAARYPSARLHTDRGAMLTAHTPTMLADYEPSRSSAADRRRTAARVLAGVAVAAGLFPRRWITDLPYGTSAWWAAVVILLCVALLPRHRRSDASAQRQRLVSAALALWLIAPLAGSVGVLFLRLPLLQLAALIWIHKAAMSRLARTFPAQIV